MFRMTQEVGSQKTDANAERVRTLVGSCWCVFFFITREQFTQAWFTLELAADRTGALCVPVPRFKDKWGRIYA